MTPLQSLVTNTISAALTIYCFYLFFDAGAHRRFGKAQTFVFSAVISVIFAITLSFVPIKILSLLILVLLTVVTSLLFKMKWYNHILMPLLIYVILALAELVVGTIMALVFSIDMAMGLSGVYYITGLFLSKFVAYLIVLLYRHSKHKILFGAFRNGAAFLLLLPISTLLTAILQYYYFIQIPTRSDSIFFFSLICYLALFLSNVLVFHLIDKIYAESIKDVKLETAADIIENQSKQYQQLLAHHGDIRKMRHDQKNYLIGVISELEEGRADEALRSLKDEYALISNEMVSHLEDNNIIYLMVSTKKQDAKQHDVKIEFQYRNLEMIKISNIDLAIILGNALDNAIEAAALVNHIDRIVELLVAVQGDTLVIHIKNPTVANVDVENLSSTKPDTDAHGFGILSIKNVVDKHHGNMEFSCQNREFQVVIILNNA